MIATRRNFMWPLLVITIGSVWLLVVADVLPAAVDDLMARAWPSLLILFGYDIVFGRRRLPVARWTVDTSLIGLVIMVVFLAGVIWFAYEEQGDVVRDDNVVVFAQTLPDEIERVQISVALERTAITINPSIGSSRALGAEFKGSNESVVAMDWAVEGTTAILSIDERYGSSLPRLADYGRGTLDITLPSGILIDALALTGSAGDVVVDLSPIRMQALTIDVVQGDITLYLPALYTLDADLRSDQGNIELFVPPNMLLNLKPGEGSAMPNYDYDRLRYDLLANGELKPANMTSPAYNYTLDIWLPGNSWLTVTDIQQ